MSLAYRVCYLLAALLSLTTSYSSAQNQEVADSLARIYKQDHLPDTTRLELLRQLSFNEIKDYNLALQYADELISLAQAKGNDKYLFYGYFQKGNKKRLLGDYKEALVAFFKSGEIARSSKDLRNEGSVYSAIADVYSLTNDYENTMLYHRKSIAILRQSADSILLGSAILNTGEAFRVAGKYDSALRYFQESERIFEKINHPQGTFYSIGNIGMVYASLGKNELAENNINKAIAFLESSEDYYPICPFLISLSEIYLQQNDIDKALIYAKRSLRLAQQYDLKEQVRDADLKLSELYETNHEPGQALDFYKKYVSYRDSLNNIDSVRAIANLLTHYEVAQKQNEVNALSRQKNMQKILLFAALAVIAIIIVLSIKLLSNYRQKQTAYALLSKEKDVSEQQRDQIDKALQQLKRTQAHLVQSEKMASLGQLTAGIAHEIQNPMNFVNNFSDLNAELIAELQEEYKNGNSDAVERIAKDIFDNSGKISYHGKRVEGIVKSMLEHSRSGTPEKRLTNINTLADEYFRLAYSGIKAKDKDFNATLQKDFDPHTGEINIVPQEIGRVIFNLAINAFHSVAAKSKDTQDDYTPSVTVGTKKENDQLFLSVKDNGTGIPPSLQDKIFQPFFTTKTTGFGVGLGLSISYDIIKAHGGEIKVQSEEGKGSEFLVILPYVNDV